ncbi:MAG: ion transporter, partial [Campylobacterota bacterium]|nr:ion transporter [Campylobacterota bacterium]
MSFASQLLIKSAYFAQTSTSYKKVKLTARNLLENNNYRYKKYVDIFMIFLIFSSIAIMVRDVKYVVYDGFNFFNHYVITFFFLLEYLLRLWIYSDNSLMILKQKDDDTFLDRPLSATKVLKDIALKKLEYVTSITAIIDLLAILPFFHELRLLRIFILFRVFKLFRYTKSIKDFFSVISSKKFEFLTLIS